MLVTEGLDHAPVLGTASLAAIAYTDAVTISADGSVNRKRHPPGKRRQKRSNSLTGSPLGRCHGWKRSA